MRDLIGRTLGHYRIVDKIGEGGMGEVYQAHDERLDRDVAVKVLPEAVAEDPQRLARFEREAKLLASLSHQNIATLYGLEEHDDQRLLVMELAAGETLAERIKRGPIPVEDALEIAKQIAEGLEAAHEVGIIHRDLKPANVMVSPEHKVKVLDFGLAKAWQSEGSDVDITHSPTLTGQMTAAGILLGTAAYMSPEQARGRTADKRADIWAFGVILFEMLTGTRLFEGETTSDVLAAVLRAEPNWSQLPPETPRPVVRLLHRCLERDSKERLHDIADARLEIEEGIARPSWAAMEQAERPEPTFRDTVWSVWPIALAALVVGALLAGGVAWKISDARRVARSRAVRVSLNLPPNMSMGMSVDGGVRPQLAISPDGRWLVFSASDGNGWRLFKRSLEHFDALPIPGTEGAVHPFFSPDGRWVGFFADHKLKKIPLDGGSPQVLADASNPWGATWGLDGTIVYIPNENEGLWRVSSTGGAPEQLALPQWVEEDWEFVWPEFLPDGEAVLVTCLQGITADNAQIEIFNLESRTRTVLIENASYAKFVPTGHLIFGRRGRIEVVPFNAERREIIGPSVPVPESIFYEMENGLPNLTFSAEGTLAFMPGEGSPRRRLLSVDLMGKERPLVDERRGYMYPRFSPDGARLAVTISEPGDINIWVIDLGTGAQTKLTREGTNAFPSWTPDGQRVTYHSYRGEKESIDWKRADGLGEGESLVSQVEPGEGFEPGSWSPDGDLLVYTRWLPSQPEKDIIIWIMARDGAPEAHPFGATGTIGVAPVISPDGEWLAYQSWESGRPEIYVQPFPGGGERYQISTDGGRKPVWSPDGRSIYYRAFESGQILTAAITTKPRFRVGPPGVLYERRYEEGTYVWAPNFDVAPDGKSFVVVKPDEKWGKATDIRVVFNWFEELKRLAPTE